jgi:hypothetical protein
MARFRVALVNRMPVAPSILVETPALPRFEGGAVILTSPVEIEAEHFGNFDMIPGRPAGTPPAFQAWPLDSIGSVLIYADGPR